LILHKKLKEMLQRGKERPFEAATCRFGMSRRLPGFAGRLALIDSPSALSAVASAKAELPHLFPNLFKYAFVF